MARLTIAALSADLEQLRVYCTKLEAERDGLRADVAQLVAGKPVHPAPQQRSTFVRRAPSAEMVAAHDAYVRKLITAREEAMRSGVSIRVAA